MKLHKAAFILLIIGGLNWLLEVLGYGLGQYLSNGLETALYVLIGAAAIFEAVGHKNTCKNC